MKKLLILYFHTKILILLCEECFETAVGPSYWEIDMAKMKEPLCEKNHIAYCILILLKLHSFSKINMQYVFVPPDY